MRLITITLFMFVLSACATSDAPEGTLGPPYNVPADADPKQATQGGLGPPYHAADEEQATKKECIRVVFCDKYPEYIGDPRYCCIGGYGKGDKD